MARGAARAADTGTETTVSPVEQDVAAGDPRESALAALMFGEPEQVVTAADDVEIDESVVHDFGGRTKAVVIISYYRQFVDGGLVKTARKGDVIATTAEHLKRGVRIKALRKLAAEDSE